MRKWLLVVMIIFFMGSLTACGWFSNDEDRENGLTDERLLAEVLNTLKTTSSFTMETIEPDDFTSIYKNNGNRHYFLEAYGEESFYFYVEVGTEVVSMYFHDEIHDAWYKMTNPLNEGTGGVDELSTFVYETLANIDISWFDFDGKTWVLKTSRYNDVFEGWFDASDYEDIETITFSVENGIMVIEVAGYDEIYDSIVSMTMRFYDVGSTVIDLPSNYIEVGE